MFSFHADRKSLVSNAAIAFLIYSCSREYDVEMQSRQRELPTMDSASLVDPWVLDVLRIRKDGPALATKSKNLHLECCFEDDTVVLKSNSAVLYKAVVSTDHRLGWSDQVEINNSLNSFIIGVNSFHHSFVWPYGYSLCYVKTDSTVLDLVFTNVARKYR